jgi:16S rRNA G966 N2-methylase RsmD
MESPDEEHEYDERFEGELCVDIDSPELPITDTKEWPNISPKEIKIGDGLSPEKMKAIFPKCARYHELRMTDVGLYSVTRREESYFITNLIVKYYSGSRERRFTITDSTAGMGGNGISFLLHPCIEHVHFVEMNSLHVEILKHNISMYGLERKASVHEGNFMDIGPQLQQDVIFHDFPWGGSNYREATQLRLGLHRGNEWIPVEDIVNEYRPRTRLQVLKVPVNFAFSHFFRHIDFYKIRLHKVLNRYSKRLYYYLILLFS